MRKRGSILLFALFLILFVSTIIVILYLANRRYVKLANEESENIRYSINQNSKIFSYYILNAFVYKEGIINLYSNVSNIYNIYNSKVQLLNYETNITDIRYKIQNNFIYAKLYDSSDILIRDLKIFNYTVDNLYKYDRNQYVYMPSEIKDFFSSNQLNRSELNVIREYTEYLKNGIIVTLGLSEEDLNTIQVRYRYDQQIDDKNSENKSSKRKVSILIEFKKSNNPFYLVADIVLLNEIKGIKLGYDNNNYNFYGVSYINTKILNVEKSAVKRGMTNEWIYYPHTLTL